MKGRSTTAGGGGRGATLLEVIVAIAAGAIVVGIALGILVTTNKTTDRTIRRESLLQQAQLAISEIRSRLETLVWPEDLNQPIPADLPLAFGKDSLAFFSSHQPTTTGLFCHYTLEYRKDVEAGNAVVPGFRRRIPDSEQPTPFRPMGGQYDTTIQFRYATEIGADLQPVWRENLDAGEKPRLIWVEVVVQDPERRNLRGELEHVRLVTAVSL
jgi:hypothetical protein